MPRAHDRPHPHPRPDVGRLPPWPIVSHRKTSLSQHLMKRIPCSILTPHVCLFLVFFTAVVSLCARTNLCSFECDTCFSPPAARHSQSSPPLAAAPTLPTTPRCSFYWHGGSPLHPAAVLPRSAMLNRGRIGNTSRAHTGRIGDAQETHRGCTGIYEVTDRLLFLWFGKRKEQHETNP